MEADRHFRAMGTTCQITLVGGTTTLLADLVGRVHDLEARWSRFDAHSELSMINATAGDGPVAVSVETYRLIDTSVSAWRRTAGRFDPTILDAVEANGYDRTYDAIPAGRAGREYQPRPIPGCWDIELDEAVQTVNLPVGVRLDPGGIGKGLAADIIAEEALAAGATGVLVDIGGDIRVAGPGPADGAWIVDVDDPLRPDTSALHLAVTDVGIATSSRLRRHWIIDDEHRHHLLDPTTGRPTETDIVAATAISASGWWSEALTKALFVTGDLDTIPGTSALMIHADGHYTATPDLMELMS